MRIEELKPFYNKTFCIKELQNYFRQPVSSLRVQLSRLCKHGKIVRLKRDRYTFPDFHPNVFVIGQEMVSPSYYSLELVLSWNGIIPEGSPIFTMVTSRKTQQYSNEFGTFNYRHLPPTLFFGVEQRKDGAWIATSEKAVLDYLYLNSRRFKADFACWQAERFDGLDTLNFKTMKKWAASYGMLKLEKLVKSLGQYAKSEEYQAHR
ncbi:hypothetical protein HZA42_00955 [Candidatus Peregrinibacteria bacterium]|nr:hypothetical protein [Candidatus Peregrinibacteria bacterium]